MLQAQMGDKHAYEKLLVELYPVVLSFIRKRVSVGADSEEITQTVFLRIHVSRHTYQKAYPLEPWLFTIARNVLSDFMRGQKDRGVLSSHDGEESSVAEEDPILEKIALQRAIQALPEAQRAALLLLKFSGLSVEQAAKKVGVSVTAFKVRAHRAYAAIKAKI